jgi:hypothetical protein
MYVGLIILGSLKYLTAETLWSELSAFWGRDGYSEIQISGYWSNSIRIDIPHSFVWYLKTRLIQYICTQSGKLRHVQPCESAILCWLWLFYCFSGMMFCFCIHKKVIWCNLSAGLFEELDPLEQRVSAGRAWASYSENQKNGPEMQKMKKYRCYHFSGKNHADVLYWYQMFIVQCK